MFIVSSALFLVSCAIFKFTSDIEIYMDELFHVPQAHLICNNEFLSWNPKITTLPGLYYLFFFPCKAKLYFLSDDNIASLSPLLERSMNLVLSWLLPYLYYNIRLRLLAVDDRWKNKTLASKITTETIKASHTRDSTSTSYLLYLYPFAYFYYFLFYTDTASLVFLLLCYDYSLRAFFLKTPNTASPNFFQSLTLTILSSLAIFMRQTNAVWVLFISGTLMLHHLSVILKEPVDDPLSFLKSLLKHALTLLHLSWGLLLPVLGFLIFVLINGGIVLGDKDNHKPAMHGAMVTHSFSIVGLILLGKYFPRLLSGPKDRMYQHPEPLLSQFWLLTFVISGGVLAGLALVYQSLSHPFLLADNRHYVFYVWKRVLSQFEYRCILAPFFAFLTSIALYDLFSAKHPLWVLIFVVATCLALFPTPLLEPRYFTTPVVIAVLNSTTSHLSSNTWQIVLYHNICLLFLCINILTISMFVTKPFQWDDGTIARFMY